MEESEPGTTTSNPKDQYPECVNSGESAVFATIWMKNCGICPDHSYSKQGLAPPWPYMICDHVRLLSQLATVHTLTKVHSKLKYNQIHYHTN